MYITIFWRQKNITQKVDWSGGVALLTRIHNQLKLYICNMRRYYIASRKRILYKQFTTPVNKILFILYKILIYSYILSACVYGVRIITDCVCLFGGVCSRVYSTWHREGVLQSRTSWIWLECVLAWAEKAIKIHISYIYILKNAIKI